MSDTATVLDGKLVAARIKKQLTPEWIRPGAAVLSVGITRTVEGVLGDVHPDARDVAAHGAPPVGGVGPMTRAMLLANVVAAAERVFGSRT